MSYPVLLVSYSGVKYMAKDAGSNLRDTFLKDPIYTSIVSYCITFYCSVN